MRIADLRRAYETHRFELVSIEAFYGASEEVTRAEFSEFAGWLLGRHAGVRSLEWIPRVRARERGRHEELARADGFSDFRITERTPVGVLVPALERPDYFPVFFVEPYEGNEESLGFDVASTPSRAEALARARDTGELTATARIRLVDEKDRKWGFMLVVPIYDEPGMCKTVEDRRAGLLGFSRAVFRVEDFVRFALRHEGSSMANVHIFDVSEVRGVQFLYSELSNATYRGINFMSPDSEEWGKLRYDEVIEVGGRQWRVLCTPSPGFSQREHVWLPVVVLVAGCVCASLFSVYVGALVRYTERARMFAAEQLRARRKLEFEVSERQRAEDALRRTQFAVDHAAEAAYWTTANGRLVYVNESACTSLGYSREALLNMAVYEIDVTFEQQSWSEYWNDLKSNGSSMSESLHRTKSGRTFPVSVMANYLRFRGEEYNCAFAVDISDRKQAEEQRRVLASELAQKNKELERIIYVSSHDLRAPLVNAQGFTRELTRSLGELSALLKSDSDPALTTRRAEDIMEKDITESIRFITASIDRMNMLINGLLKLSRLGRTIVSLRALDMNGLVSDVVDAAEYQIQEAGATIDVGPLPACMGDSTGLSQVFSNLLINALKYRDPTRAPVVHISGELVGDRAVYAVEDNGMGIASEHCDRVFEVFHRLDPTATDGEGLGLAIVRTILDRQHGNIALESSEGEGSTFFVSMPAA